LGLLAGGVAHDLNNVLSGIVGYPDLLLMELAEDSPLRKPILTMQGSGQKAADIVQDLLTLARRGVITPDVLNLNDLVKDYLASPEHERLEAFHSDVQIETNLDRELLNIKGSSTHLRKTVMNLVSNAAEAQVGGGKISLLTQNQYIDRPLKGYDNIQEGDYVVLEVSDNGVGIAAEELNRIFEPFYTKKVMGRSGTGLGMAVVWGTVQDHRGYIDIESKEGKGTTFYLYLPVTRDRIVEKKAVIPVETYKGAGQSILIVDDVRDQRELASRMLTTLGYSANTVSSGEGAIDYLKNNSTALVLLDMIMDPGIDGLDTYRQILKLHPKQKAIIASGFSETKRVKEAQKLGAGQYVKKPYTLENLGLAVRKELGQ
jgi:CheY-like chemotaxis protein